MLDKIDLEIYDNDFTVDYKDDKSPLTEKENLLNSWFVVQKYNE